MPRSLVSGHSFVERKEEPRLSYYKHLSATAEMGKICPYMTSLHVLLKANMNKNDLT